MNENTFAPLRSSSRRSAHCRINALRSGRYSTRLFAQQTSSRQLCTSRRILTDLDVFLAGVFRRDRHYWTSFWREVVRQSRDTASRISASASVMDKLSISNFSSGAGHQIQGNPYRRAVHCRDNSRTRPFHRDHVQFQARQFDPFAHAHALSVARIAAISASAGLCGASTQRQATWVSGRTSTAPAGPTSRRRAQLPSASR